LPVAVDEVLLVLWRASQQAVPLVHDLLLIRSIISSRGLPCLSVS
jgi:hypothetical protein